MGELHALRAGRRARRVVDRHGGVLVGDLEPRRRPRAKEELRVGAGAQHEPVLHRDVPQGLVELGIDEQHRGAGVLDDVADLLGIQPEVDGHEDAPEHADPEQADQEACRVGGDDGHAIVLGDPELVQGHGEASPCRRIANS